MVVMAGRAGRRQSRTGDAQGRFWIAGATGIQGKELLGRPERIAGYSWTIPMASKNVAPNAGACVDWWDLIALMP